MCKSRAAYRAVDQKIQRTSTGGENLQETLVFPMDFRWLFPSSAGPEEIALRARDEANAVGWHWNHGEILGVNGAMEQMLHAEGTVGHK